MTIALIDNGSIEPAAHLNVRAVAAGLTQRVGVTVHPLSWKHSDTIPASALEGIPGCTLEPWLKARLAEGERDFVFAPFFISAQGSIGSALRNDLERLQAGPGRFNFTFCDGLATRGAIAAIVVSRIRETMVAQGLKTPPVVVVDHGGPSAASAMLRDDLTEQVREELGSAARSVTASSMEGAEYAHNDPLLAAQLTDPEFEGRDVVIAPLFLSPGRHAGPSGDLAQIAQAASRTTRSRGKTLRCHFTELVGTHPGAVDALAAALREKLAKVPS